MAPAVLFASLVLLVGSAAARAPSDAPVAEGTNRAFAHTVETAASPEAVWMLWTDVSTWPDWDTELDSAALDGPFVVGATGRLVPASGPAVRFAVEADRERRALGALPIRRSWTPAEEGRVSVTHEVSFHGVGGRLLSGRLGPRFRRALPAVTERLVGLAEARR